MDTPPWVVEDARTAATGQYRKEPGSGTMASMVSMMHWRLPLICACLLAVGADASAAELPVHAAVTPLSSASTATVLNLLKELHHLLRRPSVAREAIVGKLGKGGSSARPLANTWRPQVDGIAQARLIRYASGSVHLLQLDLDLAAHPTIAELRVLFGPDEAIPAGSGLHGERSTIFSLPVQGGGRLTVIASLPRCFDWHSEEHAPRVKCEEPHAGSRIEKITFSRYFNY